MVFSLSLLVNYIYSKACQLGKWLVARKIEIKQKGSSLQESCLVAFAFGPLKVDRSTVSRSIQSQSSARLRRLRRSLGNSGRKLKVLRPTAVRPAASALAVVPYLIPYRQRQSPSSVVSRASGREKRKVSLGYSQHLLQCGNQQLQLQQPRSTSPNKPSNRPNSANLLKPVANCHAAAVPCAKTAVPSPSFSQQQHSLSRSPFCFSRVSFCAGVRGFLSQPSCPHGPIKSSNVAPVSPFRSCHLPPPLHLRQHQH